MGIVSAIPEKCKRCYACVRECPAKAIKVVSGQAFVIEDRCIVCGNCVKVCAQNAKRVEDSTADVHAMLEESLPVFACIAPSFPAAFDTALPGQVLAGIKRLGFAEVWTVAFGAELVSREYLKLFAERRNEGPPIIASPCPAVVAYVEKYLPSLRHALAPIVSPMIATARAIRYRLNSRCRIVFIGPCIAKKNEIRDPFVVGTVDAVLTYKELTTMFEEAGIDLAALDEGEFDGPKSCMGWTFPLSGGLLKTAGINSDILDKDLLTTEGKDRSLVALEELAEGSSHARFLDLLFCEGCINGPKMLNDLGVFARKELLLNFIRDKRNWASEAEFESYLDEFDAVHLGRAFALQNLVLPLPSDDDIAKALCDMKKFTPEDHLNCGACGYPTCREKAIAVCQGLAEASMCLPYLVEELEDTCVQLQESHQELESAQQRLVQSERMASMGQLSAGVAHEINNPLGTVLIYSHMLLRQIKDNEPVKADLQMIVNEATRCKGIVRGLLDFARQSRVSKAPASLPELIREVAVIMAPRAYAAHVRLLTDVRDNLPTMMIDKDQIKQMLLNLVGNAIDAIPEEGDVSLRAHLAPGDGRVAIEVSDTGVGIPEENLTKLFTPFFTTKEMGKGTGLGLAIAYGIVKMHSGDICAQSEEGKGTTFTISLPIGKEDE